MVPAGALEGALCVNVLIQQGLRVDTELGPLTTPCAASGVRPCFVRRLSGGCPSKRSVSLAANFKPVLAVLSLTMFEEDQYGESMEGAQLGRNGSATREGLHLRPQEQGRIGRGDRARRAAIPRAVRETLREERTGSASAVGLAATVTEPFRSGKRVRARITTRQAPFRKGRGTPCGCAALRGVDRPRPRPLKASRYVRNVSLCPSGAISFRAAIRVRRRVISIRAA